MTNFPSHILSLPQISQNAAQQISSFQRLFLLHGQAHEHRLLLPHGVAQQHPAQAIFNLEEVCVLWSLCWLN